MCLVTVGESCFTDIRLLRQLPVMVCLQVERVTLASILPRAQPFTSFFSSSLLQGSRGGFHMMSLKFKLENYSWSSCDVIIFQNLILPFLVTF